MATILSLAFAALLAQVLTPHGSNPVILNAVEESIIMDGETCHDIYKVVQTHRIYHAFATDPYCQTWTLGNGGQPVLPAGWVYPNAFEVDGTYYMTAQAGVLADYNIYLWTSHDLDNWTLANNGNPILHHGTGSDYFYTIINTSVAVDNTGRWHLLVETKDNLGHNFATGYSYSTLADGPNFDTHLSATPVFAGTSGNPWLVYVPERQALLAIAGAIPNVTWVLRAWSGSVMADLRQAANWAPAPGFSMQVAGVHLTDPSLAFSTSKPWGTMLAYHYAQIDGWRAYGPQTEVDFYDSVTIPLGVETPILALGPYGDTNLVRMDVNTIGAGTNGTGTFVAALFKGRLKMPNGTCASPAAFFETAPQTGFYLDAASLGACVGGVPAYSIGPTGLAAKGFAIWGLTSAPAGGANLSPVGVLQFGSQTVLAGTAPTIAAPATLSAGDKHWSFTIDVGPTPGSTIVLNLPFTSHRWVCHLDNQTNPLDHTYVSAQTTINVTISTTLGWAANDKITGSCFP